MGLLGWNGKSRRGLTVGEILIALALLGVILVFVIGLGLQLSTAASKGVDQTVALEIAQRLIDQASHTPSSDWVLTPTGENVTTSDPASQTTFYYQAVDTPLTDNTEPMGDLHHYQVTVFWWPSDPSNPTPSTRSGYGLKQLTMSRLIYIEDMHP